MWDQSVDLVIEEDDVVLIRPDPLNMAVAFEADEVLQDMLPKDRIRFLNASNSHVREAIKRCGECWRISPLPRSTEDMKRLIEKAPIAIGGNPIYYYNAGSGSRLLTYQAFANLASLDERAIRLHLREIQRFSVGKNRLGNPEVAFFNAGPSFNAEVFAPYDFEGPSREQLMSAFGALRLRFRTAVPPAFLRDDIDNPEWRAAMYTALVDRPEELVPEETLLGLAPEFWMHIDWLPGARLENGELIFDSVFEDSRGGAGPTRAGRICDEKVRGFIFNFLREYDDLEYINVGCVVEPLGRGRAQEGRRGVYIAEMKQRGIDRPIVRVIRMQKWGAREHLNDGRSLLYAIMESENYTEYVLDRRLACRQLGMNVPPKITARKVLERTSGHPECPGGLIWSAYFERDYVPGVATDKIPSARLEDPEFALALARLLGAAAAVNLIVARADGNGVLFDDGDEVIPPGDDPQPRELIVTDPTGAFVAFRQNILDVVPLYAKPVSNRVRDLPDARAFAEAYVNAFRQRFSEIQQEYRKRKRAFDTLFQDRPWDEGGSLACRWARMLKQLDQADPAELEARLRTAIMV